MTHLTIYPYFYENSCWVFDDARTGLKEEAFVCGMSEMIWKVVRAKAIPQAEKGFALVFAAEPFDFHGTLRLDAKVSETMTGWKRWVLKPVDPFFSKQGAGTLIHIQIAGTSKEPKFGREKEEAADPPPVSNQLKSRRPQSQ